VGRGADEILRERDDVLRVFVHASFEFRCNRFVELYGEPEIPIKKFIKEKDRRRAARYKYHTKKEWLDMQNYDMTLNTGELGMDACLSIILHMVEQFKLAPQK
jgi:cytidylate kinase